MKMETELFISHGQIAVFRLEEPLFNVWTDEHVAQGFAWRDGCVAFAVPDHDGICSVEIETLDVAGAMDEDAIRAIRVPYEVRNNIIGVGSIAGEVPFFIQVGKYSIMYELLPSSTKRGTFYDFVIKLSFIESDKGEFAILKRSGEMTSDRVIRKDAEIAH